MRDRKSAIILYLLLLILMPITAYAESSTDPPSFVIVVSQDDSLPKFTDGQLWQRGIAIRFQVNKTNISPTDPGYRKLLKALHDVPDDYTFCRLLVIRGSASPEGSALNNKRLAHERAQALVDSLRRYVTVPNFAIEERYIDEDYYGLKELLKGSDFPYIKEVSLLMADSPDFPTLKRKMQNLDGGRAWQQLLRDYFPKLRATRVVMVISHKPMPLPEGKPFIQQTQKEIPQIDLSLPQPTAHIDTVRPPRRELMAIKTNLLLDGAYVPQYGWCPMPNLEIEFYPKRGHWTFGGTFDMPWWQSSAYNDKTETSTGKDHKFFQARNYQLYARWYAHNGSGEDGFHGFYLYPYLGVTVYGIGFNDHKGWQGEAYGGGAGLGWKIPLGKLVGKKGHRTRGSHWYLEFAVQVGGFYTRYDPYVFGNPNNGSTADGHYYYKYVGSPSLFHKRDHNKIYAGPTRASITIGYDLFYRHRAKQRRPSAMQGNTSQSSAMQGRPSAMQGNTSQSSTMQGRSSAMQGNKSQSAAKQGRPVWPSAKEGGAQ